MRLGSSGLQDLANAIKELDGDGSTVRLDLEESSVWYCPEIVRHESLGTFSGEEEPVRAYIVAFLICELGYEASTIQLEKRYAAGRSNMQLDIRLATADNATAYALVEVKAPDEFGGAEDSLIQGQLFTPAGLEPGTTVLSLATVRRDNTGSIQLDAITIDYARWNTFRAWQVAGLPHRRDFPLNYDRAAIDPLARGTSRDLDLAASRAEMDRLRRTLHDRLWGGSNDDNAIYAWLVRLFLTKIRDEKVTNTGEAYACQVMHSGSEREKMQVTLARVNQRWRDAAAAYLPDLENEAGLTGGIFSSEDVIWAVETIQNISLTSSSKSSGDLLGAFFEAITRDGFKQSKGLFFTHYNIACFMVEVLELPRLAKTYLTSSSRHSNDRFPYIIDPSCGSGTFLLAAMRMITRSLSKERESLSTNADTLDVVNRWMPAQAPNTWAAEFLYGIEKRYDLAVSTMVNMVLHQDGHTHIYRDDSLAPLNLIADRHNEERLRSRSIASESGYSKPVVESMDVIITNPPFSVTPDGSVQKSLSDTFSLATERNGENMFVERWYQLLKQGGRLGAVLPESFFSTPENAIARRFLFQFFHVRAVVSLPPHAFQPWTPTRTSLLFAQKKQHSESLAWHRTYEDRRAVVDSTISEVSRKLRHLSRPRKTDTPKNLDALRMEIANLLEALEIDGYSADSLCVEDQQSAAVRAVSEVSPDEEAFAAAVSEHGSNSEHIGVIVREVGYRRTRRAESTRRNELFTAKLATSEEPKRVVRNLNDVTDEAWEIIADDSGEDALSILRRGVKWS